MSTPPQLHLEERREPADHTDRAASRVGSTITRLDVIAVVVVCLPIAVAAVRAAAGDWIPIGDDAYFTLRSMDVGTAHHPLLGAWSSGSVDADRLVNNLGPLQLDLLAPFTRWTPWGGTAVGVAVVQITAVVTAAWLLHGIAGRRGVVAAMVPVALMTWTMGSEMLITPRQHQFLLLTYLCFLIAVWAAAAGRPTASVPVVVTASLLTQTHLSYPILVAVVGTAGVVGQWLAWRGSDDRHRFHRQWIAAGVVALCLWIQPLVDQFWGRGNLVDVLLVSSDGARPTAGRAASIVGAVLVTPTGYVRRGYATFDPNSTWDRWPGVVVAVVLAALAAACLWALRSRRRTATAGCAVATLAVGAAVVNATQLPVTVFGLSAANYRWLWPTATFLLVGVAVAVAVHVRVAWLPHVALAGVAAIAVANIPSSLQVPRPDHYENERRIVTEMVGQMEDVDLGGPVRIDLSNLYFGHPFNYPLAVSLRARGIEWRFIGEIEGRRFGDARVADGTEPEVLVLWWADDARERRGDPNTVVYVDGESPLAIVLHDDEGQAGR